MVRLTKSEKQIMEMLWESEKPLSCTDMVNYDENKTWKDSYVHIMVTSLLKKGMIKVETVELVCKIYARKFAPTMTKEQYIVESLMDEGVTTKERLPLVFAAFVDKAVDMDVLEDFNRIIEEKKKQLSK